MSTIPSIEHPGRPDWRRRARSRGGRALVALLLVLAATTAYAANDILVFGDSLSAAYGIPSEQGWVSLLRKRVEQADARSTVVNASVSGETTAGGLSRLPDALERYKPSLVVLELGGNDGLRALDLQAMQRNLAAMIKASQARGADVLLLGMRIPSNYGPQYSEAFHRVYEELAQRFDIGYVTFFLEPIATQRDRFQNDGIHPDAEAQPALLEHVWPKLLVLLHERR